MSSSSSVLRPAPPSVPVILLALTLLVWGLGPSVGSLVGQQARGVMDTIAGGEEQVRQAYGKLPLSFEANQGQADAGVDFVARGAGYSLSLSATEAVIALAPSEGGAGEQQPAVLRMQLLGADPAAKAAGQDELVGKVNYFKGNDPSRWRAGIPTYARVFYTGVYPGIDLAYYDNDGHLEYDFIVSPGADPNAIALAFEGAESVSIDDSGDLVVETAAGALRQSKPFIYQNKAGKKQQVPGDFVVAGDRRVAFEVGPYDRSSPLVIDPLIYSTFLGGSDADRAIAIALDPRGHAYVVGTTSSRDFPTTPAAFDTSINHPPEESWGTDLFVTKLSADGSRLIYSTYLGGRSTEDLPDIAVDPEGNAYVSGWTRSADFPTTSGGYDTTYNGTFGEADGYVAKLSPDGSRLLYSTFLGSDEEDRTEDIAVDADGHAYVTGRAGPGFPTTAGAYDTTFNHPEEEWWRRDGFVTKLTRDGSGLIYSTYIGGSSGEDLPHNIVVDRQGQAHISGGTTSADYPTTPGAPSTHKGGFADAFATKLTSDGANVVYSTYLGGRGGDASEGIALDPRGHAYVVGFTQGSPDFPTTPGAFDTTYVGPHRDAWVAKLTPAGALAYSTYLGGPAGANAFGDATELAFGVAADPLGHAYVTGWTTSADFPTTPDAFQRNMKGTRPTAYVTKLSPDGSALAYSTYLGGEPGSAGWGIAVGPGGDIYVTGSADPGFPTTPGAFDTTSNGRTDAFVTKLNPRS